MNKLSKQRRALIVVVIISVLIIVATLAYVSTRTKSNENKVSIRGLNDISNISTDRRDGIMASLYEIVRLNSVEGTNIPGIKDAALRKGSEKQSEVKSKVQYTGTFIVDIASLKQSYRITYSYTSDNHDVFSSGYPVMASCLNKDELVFGEFDCKNPSYGAKSDTSDPLLSKLPFNSSFYSIDSTTDKIDGKTHLVVQVMMNHNSTSTKKAFLQYRDEALSWIKSQDVSVDNYVIEYRDIMNQTVKLSDLK